MNRRKFIKNLGALGIVPLLPALARSKDETLKPLYAWGFHKKDGMCYGFFHEDKGELEVVVLDYQRTRLDKDYLKKFKPPKTSWKKYWEHRNGDVLVKKLDFLFKKALKDKNIPETIEDSKGYAKNRKFVDRRLFHWTKRLMRQFDR